MPKSDEDKVAAGSDKGSAASPAVASTTVDTDKAGADDKAAAEKEAPRHAYYVVGPGSVSFGGKVRRPGETLLLTDEEALGLGDSIAEGTSPAEGATVLSAGKYRVTEFGSIYKDGKFFNAGSIIELTAQEAKEWADRIQPAK